MTLFVPDWIFCLKPISYNFEETGLYCQFGKTLKPVGAWGVVRLLTLGLRLRGVRSYKSGLARGFFVLV
jgi:hypothetical protein